jgi:hypothetical protein
MDDADIRNRFMFHPATAASTQARHETARDTMLRAARQVNDLMPDSREKSSAITALEEAMFWTNAGIARMDLDGARLD